MHNNECKPGEIFVGNCRLDRNMDYLTGVKFRIGEQARDIHGEKLDRDQYRPLFIAAEDEKKYNAIMYDKNRR